VVIIHSSALHPKMPDKSTVSLSIPIGLEVKPLALRDKDLPLTPGSEKMATLEYENAMLRRENQSLRGQLDIWAHQIKRYHKIVDGSKMLIKQMASSVDDFQKATFTMKRVEREAEREWISYKTNIEDHMAKTGIMGNQF
jgi:hypothetical protein